MTAVEPLDGASTARRPHRTGACLSPAVARTLQRRVFTPVTAALGAVAVLAGTLDLAGVHIPQAVQLVPFAVSIVLFGLPHGAMDHLVPVSVLPRLGRRRSIAWIVALYLLLGTATFALWAAAPVAGFVTFVLVTWFHWGQGDLYVEQLLRTGPRGRLDGVVTVVLRGALPMLLPLAVAPGQYRQVLVDAVHAVRPGVRGPDLPTGAGVTVALLAVVAALACAHILLGRRTGTGRRTTVETLVLIALFCTTPPVLAVGLYFTLWHSVRHIVRLELLDPRSARELERGDLLRPFARFARRTWPVTAIAIGLFVLLAVGLGTADLGSYLVFIAVLTTPHAAVVSWLDRRQHVWTTATPTARQPPDR